MSVVPSEIIAYGSVNMPEADSVTVGGAIDLTRRVSFADLLANGLLDAVSSSVSDTGVNCKIIYAGRDASGTIVNETLQLTGQTKVAGTKTLERVLYAATSTASANGPLASPGTQAPVGDVALMAHTLSITAHTCQAGSANKTGTTPALMKLQSGDGAAIIALANAGLALVVRTTGGTGANQIRQIVASSGYGTDFIAVNRDWGTLPDATTTYEVAAGMVFEILPNPVTSIVRPFATAAADVPAGAQRIYYEKIHFLNTNTVTALTSASLAIQSENAALPGSAALDIGLPTANNDTQTSPNRQTAPSTPTITFTTGAPPQSQTPPGGTFANGNGAAQAVGCWLRLTLPAGTTAYKGAADLRPSGSTV